MRAEPNATLPRVVIVGGGFGGLYAAKRLSRAPVQVTLIDRRNHHLFQPLLYQVAMAGLSPGDIAQPLRGILRKQRNVEVVLGTATSVDLRASTVHLDAPHGRDRVPFDYLILATGATDSYFGHDEWRDRAPPLKTIEDALEVRSNYLMAFEVAEYARTPEERQRALTFVVVGGGPTGVEMAGTMAELAHKAVPQVYRHIARNDVRVILCEGQQRLLSGMAQESSDRARRSLEELGVQVRTGTLVTGMDAEGVRLASGERISARNVIWAAGVRASPLVALVAKEAGCAVDSAGRAMVERDCSLPGFPRVFVIGDAALMRCASTGAVVPGMAQGAMQSGAFVARVIADEVAAGYAGAAGHAGAAGTAKVPPRPVFAFVDKGTMATIGRARAVADVFGGHYGGLPAWLLWLAVHLVSLIGFRNKLMVLLQWMWAYIFFKGAAPLITGNHRPIQSSAP